MTRKFNICAKKTPETVERISSGKNPTGFIFIQTEDYHFPEHEWDDFVVTLLNWWTENALSLNEDVIEVENRFMDGPYSFRTRREPDSNTVLITFVRDSQQVNSRSVMVSYKEYLYALRKAGEKFLTELDENTDEDVKLHEDIKKLIYNLTKISDLMNG